MRRTIFIFSLLFGMCITLSSCGHEHSYEKTVIEPSCSSQGYTEYTCECGHTYEDNYMDWLEHKYGEWTVSKESTDTEYGIEERTCSVCGYKEEQQINMKCKVEYRDLKENLLKEFVVAKGETIELDFQYELEGYKFIGWTNEKGSSNLFGNYPADKNVVFYPVLAKYHTVTFYNYHNEVIETKQIAHGDGVTPPYMGTEGTYKDLFYTYELVGWDVDFSDACIVESDLDIHGKYVTLVNIFDVEIQGLNISSTALEYMKNRMPETVHISFYELEDIAELYEIDLSAPIYEEGIKYSFIECDITLPKAAGEKFVYNFVYRDEKLLFDIILDPTYDGHIEVDTGLEKKVYYGQKPEIFSAFYCVDGTRLYSCKLGDIIEVDYENLTLTYALEFENSN